MAGTEAADGNDVREAGMDYITIVSADGHIGMPYSGYKDYHDPGYRDPLQRLST